ncbi:hypothetical protein DRE_02807 [Drechslerella stenobrocha 248]|uniref:Uncharacterized protein n=1 Tax=Drechslerella stenobrocha 248 TaxID=1043628 RepID=W7IFI8_9PEZI|nr:hypothetical protein DRE_02807 [Drechslerella stenobrocha 248]
MSETNTNTTDNLDLGNPWDAADSLEAAASDAASIATTRQPDGVVTGTLPPRPASSLYYCRYSEDGSSEEDVDVDDITGCRVFRGRDFRNSPANILDAAEVVRRQQQQELETNVGQGKTKSAPNENGATDAVDEVDEDASDLLKPGSAGTETPSNSRASKFRERLSLEDVSVPSSMFTSREDSKYNVGKDGDIGFYASLPKLDRILYVHFPWVLRFTFIFILASWWSVVPLMRVRSPGFHPENLPVVYSCAMLGVVLIALGLQLHYFKVYGWPWQRKSQNSLFGEGLRRAKRRTVEEEEKEGSRDGAAKEKKKGKQSAGKKRGIAKSHGRRTLLESYVLAVDLILLVLTLAVFGVSIVLARHGEVQHANANGDRNSDAYVRNVTVSNHGVEKTPVAGPQTYPVDDGQADGFPYRTPTRF